MKNKKFTSDFMQIYNTCVQEFKNIFRDTGVIIFFFVVPLAYPILYAFIYDQETVRDVRATVVDMSGTHLSREFIRRVDATPDVFIASRSSDMAQAKEELARKNAYGIIYIPSDFSDCIAKDEQAHISLYCDMSSMLYYKSLLLSLTEVSLDMGKEIEIKNLEGLTKTQEYTSTSPIVNESVALFNPASGFASFLIPAILIIIIQQTMLLGVGMLAGTARERGTLPKSSESKGKVFRLVIGKALAYLLVYVVITMYLVEFVPSLFSLPKIGNIVTKILFLLPYLLSVIFFSMTLSTLISGRETPMLVFVFTSVLLLFISGVSWPETAVPEFWRYVGSVFPSTHGVQGFIKINTMGADLRQVQSEYIWLWVLTAVYFVLAASMYKRLLKKQHTSNSN